MRRSLLTRLLPALALGAVSVNASRAEGQARLVVMQSSINVPSPASTEYDAGYTLVAAVQFQVTDCPTGYRCVVRIRAVPTTFNYADKLSSDVQWQLNGVQSTAWTDLATTLDDVQLVSGGSSGSGTVYFRVRLTWVGDPAGRAYSLNSVRLRLAQILQ
jgi:hypothetical protein